ncbi:hypothetical protein LZ578_04425 [Jeotgalibaca sp. MA1X17-3]|uniref:hypothetical protein n=1 Tax=Jeotgalibaca sp. MA1X17-3 TaxID=2908211 RepID=UPI001F31B047|nr:hypothetical protein [Jeotgalibaca sp. MA1X17-3]UJF16373.1 hypothetical protein LZ578_04425 [Jeotgalibaca sp. MA1X17-3]
MQTIARKDVEASFDKKQPIIGFILIVLLFIFGVYLNSLNAILPIQLIAGVTLGFVLSRARFGFAGGVKRIFIRGEGSLTKALLLMLVVTMFLFLEFSGFLRNKVRFQHLWLQKDKPLFRVHKMFVLQILELLLEDSYSEWE